MALDLTQPIFILATLQGERLAVIGGTNDEAEARKFGSMANGWVLLRAVLADAPEPKPIFDADLAFLSRAKICNSCWGEGGLDVRGGPGACERCGRVGPPGGEA